MTTKKTTPNNTKYAKYAKMVKKPATLKSVCEGLLSENKELKAEISSMNQKIESLTFQLSNETLSHGHTRKQRAQCEEDRDFYKKIIEKLIR